MIAMMLPLLLQSAPLEAVPSAPPKEKKVCRQITPTGSVLTRSVCHTKSEWVAIDRYNAEEAQRAADQRNSQM